MRIAQKKRPTSGVSQDGLLATAPQPKTSLKRVLGAAALTSFILGVVAATAVSSAVGPAIMTQLGFAGCDDLTVCYKCLYPPYDC